VLIDGIDYFAVDMRRRLYRRAAELGVPAIMAGPMGFGAAWLIFGPQSMSFDEYFNLKDGQSEIDQLIAFTVGLAPAGAHVAYMDLSRVNLSQRYGPSSGLACRLCAGVAAAEALKLILKRGAVRYVPCYAQFDAYRGVFRRGRLWGGNRHPVQLAKRWWLKRRAATMLSRPTDVSNGGTNSTSSRRPTNSVHAEA